MAATDDPHATILYHYFHPDDVVSARHFSDLAEGLVERGWHGDGAAVPPGVPGRVAAVAAARAVARRRRSPRVAAGVSAGVERGAAAERGVDARGVDVDGARSRGGGGAKR